MESLNLLTPIEQALCIPRVLLDLSIVTMPYKLLCAGNNVLTLIDKGKIKKNTANFAILIVLRAIANELTYQE